MFVRLACINADEMFREALEEDGYEFDGAPGWPTLASFIEAHLPKSRRRRPLATNAE